MGSSAGKAKLGIAAMALLAAGCTPTGEVFEKVQIEQDSLLVGARTRAIIATTPDERLSQPGSIMPRRVVCAEPSPDVAAAVSESLALAVSANVSRGDIGGAAAGQFARNFAEGIVQLSERLASISLLRDALYRACESFANGALSDTSYSLILSRYGDTMVTLLGQELAAGAFGRSQAGLGSVAGGAGGGGGGGGGQSAEQAKAAHDQALQQSNAAKGLHEEKKTALADLVKPGSTATNEQKAKAERELGQATAALVEAERAEIAARVGVLFADLGATTGTTGVFPIVGGGIVRGPTTEGVKAVEGMQANYTRSGGTAALLTSCVTALDNKSTRLSPKATVASLRQTSLQREQQNLATQLRLKQAEKAAAAAPNATPAQKNALPSIELQLVALQGASMAKQDEVAATERELSDAMKEMAPTLTPFQLSCLVHVMPGLSSLVANSAALTGPEFLTAKLALEGKIAEEQTKAEAARTLAKQAEADRADKLAREAEAKRREVEIKDADQRKRVQIEQLKFCTSLVAQKAISPELLKVCLDSLGGPAIQQSTALPTPAPQQLATAAHGTSSATPSAKAPEGETGRSGIATEALPGLPRLPR